MNRKKISITIDEQIKEIIDREAEKQNISISRAVERLIEYQDIDACILKKDLLPILQNICAVLDEGKNLNTGKCRKLNKLVRNMWELI